MENLEYLIIMAVCFFSSVAGSICGIGGGVIIKPVMDAAGVMHVTETSFLSGCTVLCMAVMSLLKSRSSENEFVFDKALAYLLAAGAVCGGLSGKEIYQSILLRLDDNSRVGAVQAFVLLLITLGTLLYTVSKKRIRTWRLENKAAILVIGVMLGMISAFLGIGGGPINLVILSFFFSMTSKQAALYSIFIIMFSQMASLAATILKRDVPSFQPAILVLMAACGIVGGLVGSGINKKIRNEFVDKLFLGLLVVIVCTNIYNIFKYV